MKKHILIIAALLLAVTVTKSNAAVHALPLPAGFSIISNPYDGPSYDLNVILSMPPGTAGAMIYRWKPAIGWTILTYRPALGWLGAPGAKILHPGEGVFIHMPVPGVIKFTGSITIGPFVNPVLGGGQFNLLASKMPVADFLGHHADGTGPATGLKFPAETGDNVYVFDTIAGYKSGTYIEGLGWLSGSFGLDGPFIPLGTGFWVQKVGPNAVWTQP